jgi:hypothetical protein
MDLSFDHNHAGPELASRCFRLLGCGGDDTTGRSDAISRKNFFRLMFVDFHN